MIHPHQLHLLGKLYHEDALQAARVRRLQGIGRKHLAGRVRKSRGFGFG